MTLYNPELLLKILLEDFGYGLFSDNDAIATLNRAFHDGTITLRDYTETVQYFQNKEEAK